MQQLFVIATWIVHSLYFLNPKFQASSHLLWLYSRVYVRPGWKPENLIFAKVTYLLVIFCGQFKVFIDLSFPGKVFELCRVCEGGGDGSLILQGKTFTQGLMHLVYQVYIQLTEESLK